MLRNLLRVAGVLSLLISAPLTATFAADMPLKAPPLPAAAPYSWTGFYLGGQVGYGWGTSWQMGADGFGNTGDYHISGIVGGGTAGYNWQFNRNWVVGLETDFSAADVHGTGASSATYGCVGGCENKIEDFGTVRGRLGYAINNVLLYGTGGWAYGRAEADIVGCPGGFCGTNNVNGWTVGGGVEYGFAPGWSAKAEYLHVDMGQFNFTTAAGCAATGGCVSPAKFDTVRLGVNYHFNWLWPH